MKKYDVTITEISIKHVIVEAEEPWEAESLAEENWNNASYTGDSDYILTSDDFVESQFNAVEIEEEH